MFCDERIINIYDYCSFPDDDREGCCFDMYYDLAFHTTPGIGYLLETKNWMINISAAGITKTEKTKWSIGENQQFSLRCCQKNDPPYRKFMLPDYLLFKGERLISFEQEHGIYILHFDSFDFKVIPYPYDRIDYFDIDDDRWLWTYKYVYGLDRLIKRKCGCGGDGEILMDFVHDFVVRCSKCHRSTWAEMNIVDSIRAWNTGKLNCTLSKIQIQTFNTVRFSDYWAEFYSEQCHRQRHRLIKKANAMVVLEHKRPY